MHITDKEKESFYRQGFFAGTVFGIILGITIILVIGTLWTIGN